MRHPASFLARSSSPPISVRRSVPVGSIVFRSTSIAFTRRRPAVVAPTAATPFSTCPRHREPPRRAELHDCNPSSGKVLLIPDVPIRRDQHFEPGSLRGIQQVAVGQPVPSPISRLRQRMFLEIDAQRGSAVERRGAAVLLSKRIAKTVRLSSPPDRASCAPRLSSSSHKGLAQSEARSQLAEVHGWVHGAGT
jgi:hypothetical protein